MMMNNLAANIQHAEFLKSAADVSQCPEDIGTEVAFVGRSNAGKSSALNALTNHGKLARVSKTPGRTQLINFFTVGDHCRLVDLPGYGYAKAALRQRQSWQKMINAYLEQRQSLKGLVLLVDSRHLFKDSDWLMIKWAMMSDCPIHVLLTKADKLSRSAANQTLKQAKKQLAEQLIEQDLIDGKPITVQLFSATKKQGITLCRQLLQDWLTAQ